MGVQEMALMLLGIGIISEQFGGGRGLQELGLGVQKIVQAPLVGTGTGLGSLAGGLRALAESFGDIGRGLAALFESIPRGPITGIPFAPIVQNGGNGGNGNGAPPIWAASHMLVTSGGGDKSTELAGGGGNVPPSSYRPPIGGPGSRYPGQAPLPLPGADKDTGGSSSWRPYLV